MRRQRERPTLGRSGQRKRVQRPKRPKSNMNRVHRHAPAALPTRMITCSRPGMSASSVADPI